MCFLYTIEEIALCYYLNNDYSWYIHLHIYMSSWSYFQPHCYLIGLFYKRYTNKWIYPEVLVVYSQAETDVLILLKVFAGEADSTQKEFFINILMWQPYHSNSSLVQVITGIPIQNRYRVTWPLINVFKFLLQPWVDTGKKGGAGEWRKLSKMYVPKGNCFLFLESFFITLF